MIGGDKGKIMFKFNRSKNLALVKEIANMRVKTDEEVEQENSMIAKDICAQYSSGNTTLQQGRITTKEDARTVRKENLARRFCV